MVENIVADDFVDDSIRVKETIVLEKDASMSVKKQKVYTIDGTIYSATYFSLIKSNKKKFKMTTEDQFELFYRTGIIMSIQVFFIYALIFIEGKSSKFVLYNNTPL